MLRRKVKKDHPNDEDDLLKDEDNHTIEDNPLMEDNTQPLQYLAYAAFLMNKDNYRCISLGRVHSSKCNSSPHSTMV